MQFGKVSGEVVATQKAQGLEGFKLLVLDDLGGDLSPSGKRVVAVDLVGSGPGELVLYTSGSSARQSKSTDKKPVDHAVVAIVDNVYAEGQDLYKK